MFVDTCGHGLSFVECIKAPLVELESVSDDQKKNRVCESSSS